MYYSNFDTAYRSVMPRFLYLVPQWCYIFFGTVVVGIWFCSDFWSVLVSGITTVFKLFGKVVLVFDIATVY